MGTYIYEKLAILGQVGLMGGFTCYYQHENITKYKFSWLQERNHNFDLFAWIGLRAYFQVQYEVQNIKHISKQPEVAYKYRFRYSTMINLTKKSKKPCLQQHCRNYSMQQLYASSANVQKKMHSCQQFYLSYFRLLAKILSTFFIFFFFQQLPLAAQPASEGQHCLNPKHCQFLVLQN